MDLIVFMDAVIRQYPLNVYGDACTEDEQFYPRRCQDFFSILSST